MNGYGGVWNYWYYADLGATVPDGGDFRTAWHSVVGTWDGTTRRIYIDGLLAASDTPPAPNIGTTSFIVGKTLSDFNLKGWIDELLIADRAWTATEAAQYSLGTYAVGSLPQSGYAEWAGANGLDPAHPEAVGNDGLANLMVYALDLRTDGTNGSPGALTDGVISFTKRPEAVTNGDVSYAIEVSTDLGGTDPWHVTTTGVTEVAGPPSTIAIDLSALGGIRHFARLKVTQIP